MFESKSNINCSHTDIESSNPSLSLYEYYFNYFINLFSKMPVRNLRSRKERRDSIRDFSNTPYV